MRTAILVAGAVIAALSVAEAAEVQRRSIPDDVRDFIIVDGVLDEDDDILFRDIAANSKEAIVLLNSEGGSLPAALEIGRTIRLKRFATAVAPEGLCASACALAWLAGSPRLRSETSHIGFHASYVVSNGTTSESGVGNALIGAYLSQIGLSENAIIFITSAPPEGMEWLSSDTADRLGISYLTMDDVVEDEAGVGAARFDPLGTVMAFYNALSAAGGEKAAALVIPEKRGIGPFNETSIHTFYGGLAVPLKLRALSLEADERVAVRYDYALVGGRVCHGRANVDTVFVYGRTLISKIAALDGC